MASAVVSPADHTNCMTSRSSSPRSGALSFIDAPPRVMLRMVAYARRRPHVKPGADRAAPPAGGRLLRQLWRRALLRGNGWLDHRDRGRGCGGLGCFLRRQIFRDDGGIERGHLRVRQPEPGFILAEQRNSPIASHRERLTVRADAHLGFIDFAVARIENVAVLVFQAVALHVPDKGNSEQRRVLAVVGAFRAGLVDVFAGAGNVLAITPSKTPSWSTTRTHTTGLPSSIFCHSPAADGSAACPGTMKASSITRTVVTGSASPNLDLANLDLASPDLASPELAS